jgi:hypothetical protein
MKGFPIAPSSFIWLPAFLMVYAAGAIDVNAPKEMQSASLGAILSGPS